MNVKPSELLSYLPCLFFLWEIQSTLTPLIQNRRKDQIYLWHVTWEKTAVLKEPAFLTLLCGILLHFYPSSSIVGGILELFQQILF